MTDVCSHVTGFLMIRFILSEKKPYNYALSLGDISETFHSNLFIGSNPKTQISIKFRKKNEFFVIKKQCLRVFLETSL